MPWNTFNRNCGMENFIFTILLTSESSSFTFFDGKVQVNRNYARNHVGITAVVVSGRFLRAPRSVK